VFFISFYSFYFLFSYISILNLYFIAYIRFSYSFFLNFYLFSKILHELLTNKIFKCDVSNSHMCSRVVGNSLEKQKVKAYIHLLQENTKFWNAFLVFLGALFILSAIPFFPLYLVPIIALLCGATAYIEKPYVGTLLSIILALIAISYQSSVFGLVFLLVLAITLFEMFENWGIISVLEILIFAPFAPYPLSFLGGFVMLGMVLSSLYFGSKKSLMISIPSVLVVLLLSSIWLVPTDSFFYLETHIYEPGLKFLQLSKDTVPLFDLPYHISTSLSNMVDFSVLSKFNISIGKMFNNLLIILFEDSGLIQLFVWSIILFLIGVISGKLKKYPQTISSILLLVVPTMYFFLSQEFVYPFEFSMFIYAFISVLIIGTMEYFKISFSKEREINKKKIAKKFGKFGLQDLSFSAGVNSLKDVGNYTDIKEELKSSVIMPIKEKEIAYTYGLKPPSGILLFGPPGTGKTMLMRAFANEINYPIYYVKSSDILSQWYGESEKNLSELFSISRKNSPCILFFDEIDAIGKKRTEFGNDSVGPKVLTVFLQEIDGFKSNKPVIIVGATNIPQKLDEALMRPGRFDKIIYMHLPDFEGRKKIFQVHLKNLPTSNDIDYDVLAKKTNRFSGADIANVVKEASNLTAKEAEKIGKVIPISQKYFITVLKSIKASTSLANVTLFRKFEMDFERRVGKKKLSKDTASSIGWKDVAGLDEVKKELLESIELPLIRPKLMKEFNVKPTKGILLFGPPGTGKTLIVKAASNELNVSFISLNGADLMKEGYTHAVNIIKETFNRAKENKPSIIFMDEVEAIASSRGMSSSDVLSQLLSEMDGMTSSNSGVMVVATTNKPSILDPAILRPGRFDKLYYISPPDEDARKKIFEIHLGKFSNGLDVGLLAKKTDNFSGADIASICQEVKMSLLRDKLHGRKYSLSTETVLDIIKGRRPSITISQLKEYMRFLDNYGERR